MKLVTKEVAKNLPRIYPATEMDEWEDATANDYPTVNHPL